MTNEKPETKKEIIADITKSGVSERVAKEEEKLDGQAMKEASKKEDAKETPKPTKAIVKKEKPKKTVAVVHGSNIPISTKVGRDVCKFITKKRIGDAIRDLEDVVQLKKAVPMKGEIPHRKGAMSSGRFPKKASEHFIVLLRSLAGNASEMDDPFITEAIANIGARPFGRFGRIKRKRTHVKIVAKEKINREKKQWKKRKR